MIKEILKGNMKEKRFKIIINADDYGLNQSCTEAICKAFMNDLITDTTMVANGTYFKEAVDYIQKYQLQGKVGIHFNLTEGKPLTETIATLPAFSKDGLFHGKINRIKRLNSIEKKAVYEELSAQIIRMEEAGIDITHADSHHHIHTGIFIAPIFAKVCKEHGINKVRLHRNIGSISLVKKTVKKLYNCWLKIHGFETTTYFGSVEDVGQVGVMDNLEIMVHPDFDRNGTLIDKTGELEGCAVGKTLELPAGCYTLRGYKDL